MGRVLREPRWIALIIAVPIGVVLCFMLSDWQWNRYENRKEANVVLTENIGLPTASPQAVMGNATTFEESMQWRSVQATGTYDADGEVLIRRKPLNAAMGFWVATPLITSDNRILVVNRGWVKAIAGAQTTPDVPAPPDGVVTVMGRLQPSDPAEIQPSDMPTGQVSVLSTASIAAAAGGTGYPGYLELTSSSPQQAAGLTPIPLPQIDEGPHLSYSLQWIAFAIMFVVGLVLLLRREFRLRKEDAQATDSATISTHSGESARLPQDSPLP